MTKNRDSSGRNPPPPSEPSDVPDRTVVMRVPELTALTRVSRAPDSGALSPFGDTVDEVDPSEVTMVQKTPLPAPAPRAPARAAPLPATPQLRTDLVIVAENAETVTVRRPNAAVGFPIYRTEWRIAQLMDGSRNYNAIAKAASQTGMPATPDLVRSFVRELRNYGFLADANAPTRDRSADIRNAIEASQSDEQTNLLRTALTMEMSGNDASTIDYLEAAFQIDTTNTTAREALEKRRPLRDLVADVNIDEMPVRRETIVEHAPAAPRSSSRALVIILAIALTAVSLAALAVAWSQRELAAKLAALEQAKTTAAVPAAPQQLLLQTPFSPAHVEAIQATMAGVWTGPTVAPGDTVRSGDVLGGQLDAKAYAKLAAARKRYDRVKDSARFDDVYKFFLADAKAAYEAVEKATVRTDVVAPDDAKVVSIATEGAVLEVGTQVAELKTRASMVARIKNSSLSMATGGATCKLVDFPAVRCSVAVETDETVITLEEPRGVPVDEVVSVTLVAAH